MGKKQRFVANDARTIPGIGRNRIYEKQRQQRTRGERDSSRQHGAVLMNPEITLLAREEETIMPLSTCIAQRQSLSANSHEWMRRMALVFGFDLNTINRNQRMHYKRAKLTFVEENIWPEFSETKNVGIIPISYQLAAMNEMNEFFAQFVRT